ncbi:helix-turn-helix domain-containing protein [Flavobacterium psychrotolerans]|uniref:Transcriptional regulator n=1 Tax=Flavobacterium psychrotolerans TaxID=2169410 RepID=A0A2U1JJ34_9FLAO|nr:ArsR family transcriptional regulator [Flavobacterium psychrotolerans]PWA04873.1 transcriptional regulator [Flavobacterium psychrotolerans]
MLESLITSKTRLRILVKFFINVANNGYLRGLAEELNESTNSIRKELNNLLESGYLEKESIQNKVIYKANTQHPLFGILQKIVHQHIGLDTIVEMILQRMGAIDKVVIIGDYANGSDSGIIEVVLVGTELNVQYIDQLAIKIEKEIKRKVTFYVDECHNGKGLIIYEAS